LFRTIEGQVENDLSIAPQRKTNSQVGALLLICGLLAAMFGLFGSFIAGLQFVILQFVPSSTVDERDKLELSLRIVRITLLQMPMMALLGGLLLLSGWHIRRGNSTAIRIARWTLLGAIGFGVVYCINIGALFLEPRTAARMLLLSPLLEPYRYPLYAVQGIIGIAILFGPPMLLLFLLRRLRPMPGEKQASATNNR
jgi:hypothetical protein